MKRLSLYGLAVALGHYLAVSHKGTNADIVLYHSVRNVLYFVGGWCECTDYQITKAVRMMDAKCITRLASIKKFNDSV